MVRVPTHRVPTHPGEMLREEFLRPMGITRRELAQAIHVPYQRVNELVNGRRGVTPNAWPSSLACRPTFGRICSCDGTSIEPSRRRQAS